MTTFLGDWSPGSGAAELHAAIKLPESHVGQLPREVKRSAIAPPICARALARVKREPCELSRLAHRWSAVEVLVLFGSAASDVEEANAADAANAAAPDR